MTVLVDEGRLNLSIEVEPGTEIPCSDGGLMRDLPGPGGTGKLLLLSVSRTPSCARS